MNTATLTFSFSNINTPSPIPTPSRSTADMLLRVAAKRRFVRAMQSLRRR